jgi:hypothetical protein
MISNIAAVFLSCDPGLKSLFQQNILPVVWASARRNVSSENRGAPEK